MHIALFAYSIHPHGTWLQNYEQLGINWTLGCINETAHKADIMSLKDLKTFLEVANAEV